MAPHQLTYAWNSSNADTYSGSYTVSPSNCPSASLSFLNSAAGSIGPFNVQSPLAGCDYIISYTASQSSTGKSSTAQITVDVLNAQLAVNGATTTTLSVGQQFGYTWSSVNADTYSGSYTVSPSSCPAASYAFLDSAKGSSGPYTVSPSLAGCTYTATYTVSNSNSSGNQMSASVIINVPGSQVSPPSGVTISNTPPAVSCGQINLTWQASTSSPSGYVVLWNNTNNIGTAHVLATTTAATLSYTDTAPGDPNNNYYWVEAFSITGGVTSYSAAAAAPENPIAVVPCQANMSSSDKNITGAVTNGVSQTYPTTPCQGQQSQGGPPPTTIFRLGDTIDFEIDLCNNSVTSQNAATNVTVDDSMLNLARYDSSQPILSSAAWNSKLSGNLISPQSASGTEPNLTLHFVIPGSIPEGGYLPLTLQAKINVPANAGGSTGKFQNSAVVNYNKDASHTDSVTALTKLILFTIGTQPPSAIEVAP